MKHTAENQVARTATPKVEMLPVGTLMSEEPPVASALRRHVAWLSRAMAQHDDGEIDPVVFDREVTYALRHLSALTIDVAALESPTSVRQHCGDLEQQAEVEIEHLMETVNAMGAALDGDRDQGHAMHSHAMVSIRDLQQLVRRMAREPR